MYEELEPFILWLSSRCKAIFTRLCCKIYFFFFFNFVDGAIFYFIYIISFVDIFPTFNWYLEIGAESQPQVQPVFFGPVPYVFWIILHGQLCSCTRQKQLRLRKEWAKNWRTLQNITLTLCAVEARLPEFRCPYSSQSLGDLACGISPSNQQFVCCLLSDIWNPTCCYTTKTQQ